ncbi:MAG: hypothetical protein WCB68_10630 [Pyrinomonadaceae bacterium]
MSEGERKYTGFAAIYKLEQEKLKRESPQATPQASPPVEASEESPDSAVLEESSSAKSNSDSQLSTSNTTSVEESVADTHPVTPPAPITNLRPTGHKSGRRTRQRPALAKASTATPVAAGTVEYYVQKWKQIYRLNKGELKVMKVMFDLSHGAGVSECYIKVPEVAASAQLKKRRCQYVIRSLEDLGFLDRLEDYDPTNRLGTKYRVNLKPRILDIE